MEKRKNIKNSDKKPLFFKQSFFYEINTDSQHRYGIECIKNGLIPVFNKSSYEHIDSIIKIIYGNQCKQHGYPENSKIKIILKLFSVYHCYNLLLDTKTIKSADIATNISNPGDLGVSPACAGAGIPVAIAIA